MKAATIARVDSDDREKAVKLYMSGVLWKQLKCELQFVRKHCVESLCSDVSRLDDAMIHQTESEINDMIKQIKSCLRSDVSLFITKDELEVLVHVNNEFHDECEKWDRPHRFHHERVGRKLTNCELRFEKELTY